MIKIYFTTFFSLKFKINNFQKKYLLLRIKKTKMDIQENQNNIQLNTNINNVDNIFSPIKELNTLETPQIKNENKFQILPSPFIKQISPTNKMDFTNILSQNNNEDTPNLINKSLPFSPLISSYTNKIYNTKYENFVSKNLMNEFSPFKPQILYSTPNNNSINNEKE